MQLLPTLDKLRKCAYHYLYTVVIITSNIVTTHQCAGYPNNKQCPSWFVKYTHIFIRKHRRKQKAKYFLGIGEYIIIWGIRGKVELRIVITKKLTQAAHGNSMNSPSVSQRPIRRSKGKKASTVASRKSVSIHPYAEFRVLSSMIAIAHG